MKNLIRKLFAKLYYLLKSNYYKHLYSNYRKRYSIHNEFYFNGEGTLLYGTGKLITGAKSYIGQYSILQIAENETISIGQNCSIGPFFKIWTQTSEVDHDFNTSSTIKSKTGSVFINDAVWIGANVIISPGVTIGANRNICSNPNCNICSLDWSKCYYFSRSYHWSK